MSSYNISEYKYKQQNSNNNHINVCSEILRMYYVLKLSYVTDVTD